jgi:hypothetical protein
VNALTPFRYFPNRLINVSQSMKSLVTAPLENIRSKTTHAINAMLLLVIQSAPTKIFAELAADLPQTNATFASKGST